MALIYSTGTLFTCISYCRMHLVERTWAPSQYPKRRISVRSRKVSKPRDLCLELSDRSEIWQALRQQCCRCAGQISKRYNLKYRSRGFETLRDLTERSLFGYWDGDQVASAFAGPLVLSHHLLTKCNTKNSFFAADGMSFKCRQGQRVERHIRISMHQQFDVIKNLWYTLVHNNLRNGPRK